MECDFQVGDKVVCIEECYFLEKVITGCHGPVRDERYTIRQVRVSDLLCQSCAKHHIYVHLNEIIMPDMGMGEVGFRHGMFRKLLTIDDFKSVDTPAPVDRIKEPEDA